MGEEEDLQVRSLAELAAGEEIEAWHRGRLAHRGRVVSTLDGIDLFWIIDSRTGARRLLDLEQLSVRRVAARKPAAAVGKPGPPGARKPAAAAPQPSAAAPAVVPAAVRQPIPAAVPAAVPKPGPAAWRHVAFVEAG
jgi:hypothetical protein